MVKAHVRDHETMERIGDAELTGEPNKGDVIEIDNRKFRVRDVFNGRWRLILSVTELELEDA